jgi:Ni,Fe-hydrogenase III component G
MKQKQARLITISYDGESLHYHFALEGKIKTLSAKGKLFMSICEHFPGAELYEREIMEKFGVKFDNHPKPINLFT